MNMTLTEDDLGAIKKIIDDAVEESKLQTAAGFVEVHEKFAKIDEKFAKVDEKFAQMDEKFTQADERMDGLITQVQAVSISINNVDRRLEEEIKLRQDIKLDITHMREALHTA
jgi:hypothetical protein